MFIREWNSYDSIVHHAKIIRYNAREVFPTRHGEILYRGRYSCRYIRA